MMFPVKTIKDLIEQGIAGAKAEVTGDGYQYEAHVSSAQFAGLSTVKQQQMVYATVNHLITSGQVHALSVKTTPTQT